MSNFLIQDFFKSMPNLEDLASDDPLKKNGVDITDAFTRMVDWLRNYATTPNVEINKLMALFWDLVGNKICPSAIANLPSVSFWSEHKADSIDSIALILCPPHWLEMIKQDELMQFGALISAASKAKDYWNGKIIGVNDTKEESLKRAYSYEAEFLRMWLNDTRFVPNEYQKCVLRDFPYGMASLPRGTHYISRPYPDAGPPYPIDIEKLSKSK